MHHSTHNIYGRQYLLTYMWKNVIGSIFGSNVFLLCHFIVKQGFILSVECGEEMLYVWQSPWWAKCCTEVTSHSLACLIVQGDSHNIAQFVTPTESCLREKSFSLWLYMHWILTAALRSGLSAMYDNISSLKKPFHCFGLNCAVVSSD